MEVWFSFAVMCQLWASFDLIWRGSYLALPDSRMDERRAADEDDPKFVR